MSDDVFGPDSLPAFKVAVSAAMSFVVMMVDFIWLIRDEAKYIWPKVRCSWYARAYTLARYGGVASQIFNVCFTLRMYLRIRTSPVGCSVWFAYQAVVVQTLLVFVEGLLMRRIYALFFQSRMILSILILFALGQAASMMISARFTLPSVGHTDTCIILKTPPGNAFFGATTMMTNLIIFFLTFWKYLCLPSQWTQHGLGRVVIRDSALAVLAISVVMLFLTLSALEVIRTSISGNITYYWLVCVLWVAIGRIVVNHEKLPRGGRDPGGNTWKSTVQLTSHIELGEISQDGMLSHLSIPSSGNGSVCHGTVDHERSLRSSTSDMVIPSGELHHRPALSNERVCVDLGSDSSSAA